MKVVKSFKGRHCDLGFVIRGSQFRVLSFGFKAKAVSLVLLALTPLYSFPVLGWEGVSAKTETAWGLHITTFETPQGKIKIYLPDDMAAGDTVSGAVIVEPEGKTEEKQRRNTDELNGYVVEVERAKTPVAGKILQWTIPEALAGRVSYLILKDKNGKKVARAEVPIEVTANIIERTTTPTPEDYHCPIIGQAGRPIQITGPFDGNFGATGLKIGGEEARILAESPRKLVVESSRNIVGLTEIELKENDVIVKLRFNNLRVTKIKEEKVPPTHFTEEPTKVETKEEATKKELLAEQTPAPFKQVGEKVESEKTGIKEEQIPSSTKEPIEIETGKKEETAKRDIAAAPRIEPEGKYTVQIGSFKKQEEAKKILEALKLKGYPVFIKRAEIPQKGTLYRVRVGTFKTIKEARLYGDNLRSSEPSIESVLITVNN